MSARENVIAIYDLDRLKVKNQVARDLEISDARLKLIYPSTDTINGVKIGYLNEVIYIANNKGVLDVWDYQLKNKLQSIKVFQKTINSLTLSKHYEFILVTSDIGAKVLQADTFELVTELRNEFPINCAQMSPIMYHKDKPRFHVIMGGGTRAQDTAFTKEGGLEVNIMNAIHGHRVCTLSGHYGTINWIECCPDGSGFISAGEESQVLYFRFDKQYFDSPEFE